MKILHIITGGTILGEVPEYEEVNYLSKIFNNTIDIEKYATKSMKIPAEFSTKEVCRKDSRDITDIDRSLMLEMIKQGYDSGVKAFIITHGTYTMPDTGVFLINNLQQELLDDINVIITGAMFPTNFIGSDALLNVGATLAGLLNQKKPFGVKVCMHGIYWDPRKISKDAENLIFEEK